MGFMDQLKKLTRPYDDDDNDFYDGADPSFKQPVYTEASTAQMTFENTFAEEPVSAPEPAQKKPKAPRTPAKDSSAPAKAKSPRKSAAAKDSQVVLFSPKTFDEAGAIVSYLMDGNSLLLNLEEIPHDVARRILDFISGITFALNANIKPVSQKTFFVSPENVDLLDAQEGK